MDQILTIRGKEFTVHIPESAHAENGAVLGGHPLYYVMHQPKATANYLEKLSSLFEGLEPGANVFEFCGGIGLVPMACWDVLNPHSWVSVDIDPSCAENYQCSKATPTVGDMYTAPIPESTDIIVCDFPNNTLPKMWREPKRMGLLRRIADFGPKFWEITDVGYYWIHLANHWPIYERQFGVKPTRENYHLLFDQFMRDNYGYTVINWTVGGGAQYFLLEKI